MLPLKMSFLRKQESISFGYDWTPPGVYPDVDRGGSDKLGMIRGFLKAKVFFK
jgi:hypothetical protein